MTPAAVARGSPATPRQNGAGADRPVDVACLDRVARPSLKAHSDALHRAAGAVIALQEPCLLPVQVQARESEAYHLAYRLGSQSPPAVIRVEHISDLAGIG